MKKVMSLLLTFAMVFACLPMQGGAAEGDAQYVEITIDLSDVANRTAYSTAQQVWQQNGITVTNNKSTSTTNVGDYIPARFYKSSDLLVECENMTQITFVGTDASKYKTPIGDTLTAEGYTPTVDGDNYTISFAEPVDSFSISSFSAQVRMGSITVITRIDQSAVDTPVEVSFDLNYDGATGAPGNAAVMVGSPYGTALPAVSREGFVFGGWFTNAGCTGEAVTEETVVTRAHTLYAKWLADVSFHLNYDGATDAPENTAVAEGSTYGALPTVSREGYIFGGWFTDSGCTGTAVKATDVVNESCTLYAKWTATVEGEISEITIDFSTTDQRTSYSTEQQVWTNGALTFTNDKATSTTDVGDFSNPVRLYKDSSVTIACAGMTQIVIVSNGTATYKTALIGALDAAGFTYTTSDDTYTILLAEPADTFSFDLSVGQVRFESITVIAQASGGETPDPTPDSAIVEDWGLTLNDEVVVKFNMNFTTGNSGRCQCLCGSKSRQQHHHKCSCFPDYRAAPGAGDGLSDDGKDHPLHRGWKRCEQ